ncbi:unnamed protein product [Lasius platythorax]|uniref:Uncharacterized protein n=1 Tax=Lasius platythorax TaxID=488582 RepID=A0AAV2N4V6_9HYME
MTWQNCYGRNEKILLQRVIIDDDRGNTRTEGFNEIRSPEIAPGMIRAPSSLIGKNGHAQTSVLPRDFNKLREGIHDAGRRAAESALLVNERAVVASRTIASRHRGSQQDPIVRASLFRNTIVPIHDVTEYRR